MSAEAESQITYRVLFWAEKVTVDVKTGEPLIERSSEVLHIAALDPQQVHRRVAKSIPFLVKDGKLI